LGYAKEEAPSKNKVSGGKTTAMGISKKTAISGGGVKAGDRSSNEIGAESLNPSFIRKGHKAFW